MDNINSFISCILESKKACNDFCEIIENDDTYLRAHYEGQIKEDLLIELIKLCEIEFCYEPFLSALTICLKKEEVTPKVFNYLISFHGQFRESILIGLAHCSLSYYQLIELNKLHIDEAFSQLLKLYMEFNCFSEYDLEMIMQEWKGKPPKYIIDYISKHYGKTYKGKLLKEYCVTKKFE